MGRSFCEYRGNIAPSCFLFQPRKSEIRKSASRVQLSRLSGRNALELFRSQNFFPKWQLLLTRVQNSALPPCVLNCGHRARKQHNSKQLPSCGLLLPRWYCTPRPGRPCLPRLSSATCTFVVAWCVLAFTPQVKHRRASSEALAASDLEVSQSFVLRASFARLPAKAVAEQPGAHKHSHVR